MLNEDVGWSEEVGVRRILDGNRRRRGIAVGKYHARQRAAGVTILTLPITGHPTTQAELTQRQRVLRARRRTCVTAIEDREPFRLRD